MILRVWVYQNICAVSDVGAASMIKYWHFIRIVVTAVKLLVSEGHAAVWVLFVVHHNGSALFLTGKIRQKDTRNERREKQS